MLDLGLAALLVAAIVLQFIGSRRQKYAKLILVLMIALVSVQFLKQLWDEKTLSARIERLTQGQEVIQSMSIRTSLQIYTEPRPPGGGQSIVGPGDAIELIVKSDSADMAIMFSTGANYTRRQVDSNTLQIHYEYAPTEPIQILGRSIEFLTQIASVHTNYMQDFAVAEPRFNDGFGTVTFEVVVNGIEVVKMVREIQVKRDGWHSMKFSAKEFQQAPIRYRVAKQRVER